MSSGGSVRAVVAEPGLGLGWGWAAGLGRGAATGLGHCLALVLGFGRAAGAGFAGVYRHLARPVEGYEAAGALAMAGAPAPGTGMGAPLGDFARGLGGGLPDDDVLVEVDQVVVLVEVVGSEAEETDLGDGGGARTAGAGAGCWVVWAMRTRAGVRASGVCARFLWCPVCLPVLVLSVVSCVVRGGVVEWVRLRGQIGYPGGVHFSSGTCGCACWRHSRVPKKHCWMPGLSSSVRWG